MSQFSAIANSYNSHIFEYAHVNSTFLYHDSLPFVLMTKSKLVTYIHVHII